MVGRVEGAVVDAFERLVGVGVAARGTVVDQHRPGERRFGKVSVLRIGRAAREVDALVGAPCESRVGRVDGGRGRFVARRHGEHVGHVEHVVVVGDLQAHVVGSRVRVREGRVRQGGVVELAVAVEIPGVGDGVAGLRRRGAGAREVDRERREPEQRRAGGHGDGPELDADDAASREIDVIEVPVRADLQVHGELRRGGERRPSRGVRDAVPAREHDPHALARVVREEEGVVVARGVIAAARVERHAGDGRASRVAAVACDEGIAVSVREDRRSRLRPGRADVEVREMRMSSVALEAGPAEVARAREIGNAVDLLEPPRAHVAEPDLARSGLDREAEGIAQAEADDPALVGVGRGEEGIVRHGLAGHGVHAKDGAVEKTRRARRPPRALAAQRAALGRGLAERGADRRRGISAGIRGRVVRPGLSRYRNGSAELSPVRVAEARPVTGAHVELPVGAEGERAGRVAGKLLAPAFEQHVLGPRGLGRQKARELARDDAAVRARPRSVGRGGTRIESSADDAPLRHRSSRQGVAGIEDVDGAAPLVRRGGVEAGRDREAEQAAVDAL